jgi:hypothetical protein
MACGSDTSSLLDCLPLSEYLSRITAEFATRWWHWFFFAQPEFPERVINAGPDSCTAATPRQWAGCPVSYAAHLPRLPTEQARGARQRRGVRQPVEPVAAQVPLLAPLPRQGVRAGSLRHARVERGVDGDDVREAGQPAAELLDGRHDGRDMQRRQRHGTAHRLQDRLQDRLIDQGRGHDVRAAMHQSVADSVDLPGLAEEFLQHRPRGPRARRGLARPPHGPLAVGGHHDQPQAM